MTVQLFSKDEWIKFFRSNGFNVFPIPANQKWADRRYDSERTEPNQTINEKENYGIIPTKKGKNAIVDLDNKERYRTFAENMIKDNYLVIETPSGWHIPVVGLDNYSTKIELFDYEFQPNKKIIEIQGIRHYVIGVESQVLDETTGEIIKYKNKGTKRIWNAKGKNFHTFVDAICKICSVEARKKNNPSSYKYLRERFEAGEIPLKGSSNDYYFQSALVCNTNELSKNEAIEKIKIIYDKWIKSKWFSNRPFSNIVSKINEVYEKNLTTKAGRPIGSGEKIDRTGKAQELIETRKIYSNAETHEIFENKNGFLEKLNDCLKKELLIDTPEMEKADYESVLFKLESLAEDLPPTNKDLIVFKDGVYSKKAHTTIETDDLADMGFSDYNYLPKTKDNEPKEFLKVLFGNVPKYQHPRIRAGLKAIFNNRIDSRISIIYGKSGVGKSTGLTILAEILGNEYAFVVELNLFLEDRATRAKIKGKRLLIFQDLPKEWKDFTTLKTLTGELKKSERGFQKDTETFDNKLKIWASGNYLAEIPEIEKDAMYTRRLSLINNTRTEPYKEDSAFADRIIKNESEKIISWIINLTDEECEYENRETVQTEWENIASPEIKYLNHNYQTSATESSEPIMKIIKECFKSTSQNISLKQMMKSMRGLGYVIKNNTILNIEPILSDKKNQKLS